METVYKLKIGNETCIFMSMEDAYNEMVGYEFDNYEKGDEPLEMTITVCEMSEEEIENLPQFEGF